MCGIIGAVSCAHNGLGDSKVKSFIYQAMVTGWLRGEESTGFYTVNKKDNQTFYHKSPIRGTEFMDTKIPRSVMANLDDCSVFVGHHRWSTRGVVNHTNAHPFDFGRILLVHNGTVGNHLDFPHQSSSVPAVDSARIAYNLSKMPGAELEFLSKITGSYALVWWDSDLNKLRIARNPERPLNYAWSEDKKYFFFASERLHLLWLLDRCDIPLEKQEDEDKVTRTIWAFPTLTLHDIYIDNKEIVIDDTAYTVSNSPYRYTSTTYTKSTRRHYGQWPGGDEYEDETIDRTLYLPQAQRPQAEQKTEQTKKENKTSSTAFTVFHGIRVPWYNDPELPQLNKRRLKELNKALLPFGTSFGKEHRGWPFVFESRGDKTEFGRGYFTEGAGKTIEYVVPNMTLGQFQALKDFGQYASLRAISLLREEKNKQDWLIVAQIIWSETRKHWEAVCQEIANTYDTSIQKVFLGPGDRYISKERFLDLIKGGCAHCNDPLFLTDEQDLNWIKDDRPICAKCWNSAEFWSSPACGLNAHPNAVI